MKDMPTGTQKDGIHKFYGLNRETFRILSRSGDQDSHFLNFGYWDKAKTLFDAQHALADHILELVTVDSNMSVLEVGCGIGGFSAYVHRKTAAPVVGIDLLEEHVAAAQRLAQGRETLRFEQGDAGDLSFEVGSFDMIYSVESAFHYQEKDRFAKEAYRVLRPGGHLVMVDITSRSVDDVLFRRGIAFASSEQWTEILQQAGFSVEQIRQIGDRVFTPLNTFFSGFTPDLQQRNNSFRYWGMLLQNYARNYQAGNLGYGLFVATKA